MGEIISFFPVLGSQLPSPGRSGGSGGSREPIEALGKLQNRFPRAGIGQLPSYLPRLLGAIEPVQGFIQNSWHLVLPATGFVSLRLSLPKLRLRYQGHTAANADATSHTAPQRPIDRSSAIASPTPGASLEIASRVASSGSNRPG